MTQTDQQNVPKLRFPGFEGDWILGTISSNSIQIIDGDRGANYPKSEDFSPHGDCLFLSAKNVTKTGFVFDELSFISASKDMAMSKGKLSRGDIVLTTRGSLGHIALFSDTIGHKNIRINSGMVLLRTGTQHDPSFLYQQLISGRFQREVERTSFGSAQPQLTVKGIKKMPVAFCTLPEQRMIASFLSAADTKIAQLARKKALLEDYKKGCMQQLFSQAIRFKDEDGNDFPDWEERQLGSMGRFIGGGTPDTNVDGYWTGEIPWVSSSDLFEGLIRSLKITRWITQDAIKASATQITPKGAILIVTRVGIGKCAVAPEDLCTSQDFTNFVPEQGLPEFFAYWLSHNQSKLLSLAQGTSIKGIPTYDLKALKVHTPLPNEQQKIADFLSALDHKITLLSDELAHAQTFKKGLLQQMFV